MERQFHPLADILPLLNGSEFEALTADIQEHGLREPITLIGDLILDGRNRYRACLIAGVNPVFHTYEGLDPAGFVLSLNVLRRHLDESQRAMVAKKLANLGHGQRADYQAAESRAANLPVLNLAEPVAAPVSQAAAAKLLNVSERSVRDAGAVLKMGIPELIETVQRGRAAVSAAAEVARLPAERQRDIVSRGPSAIAEAKKEIRAAARKAAIGDTVVPTPAKAKQQAVEKGGYVLATDGNLHGPDNPAERQKQLDLYQFRDLVRGLAAVTVTPARAIEVMTDADRHFLRPATGTALTWLAGLKEKLDAQ